MIVVADASAVVEYLLQTVVGLRVGALLDDADVSAPELVDAEVLAVLRREVLARRLDPRRAAIALEDLAAWGAERITHRVLLQHAWALRGHVSAYDALYVAAAMVRGATLVTADGPLVRAPRLGVVVHDVRAGG